MEEHNLPSNFLKLISEHLPDMLWTKDINGVYLFANQEICKNLLMAENPEEVVGKTDVFFALREREKHPQNPEWHTFGELCHNSDDVVLKEMKAMRFEEYGNIRGKLVWLEVHKAPFYDEEGKLIGVIGSGRDITKQKKLEQELENTNKLIQSGPVVVFEWNPQEGWPIQFVSKNVNSVLGLNYEKLLVGIAKFSDYIHPDDLQNVTNEVTRYMSTFTESFIQEYRLVQEDKSVIWIKDYTIINYNEDKTPRSIKGYIFDDTAQKLSEKHIKYLNSRDQLTGLANRYKLQLDMEDKHSYACAIFNITRFREVNDFFGIEVGNSILVQISKKMKRMGTNPYRIGGDEFVMLFHEPLSRAELKERVKSTLTSLQDFAFSVANETIKISFNVGIAFSNEKNLNNTDKLLTKADIALHQAKEKKIPYAMYEKDENIEEMYKKNIEMANTVHKALRDNRIICHYQPIVTLDTNKINKYESLVRMIAEDGSVVSPIEFLSVAKKTKLYPDITKEVIHHACKYFSEREEEFSVNLSMDDINDPVITQEIIRTIIETNTANRIIFEILETEEIENYSSVVGFITQVKALGAKIAIDDFGSGYSSFEHILQLNVDYIKIDGSLIKGIASNKKHRIVVETIVEFAKKMGAQTIAEFVCDKSVYDVVKSLGIDFSQGYYTGKPELLIKDSGKT